MPRELRCVNHPDRPVQPPSKVLCQECFAALDHKMRVEMPRWFEDQARRMAGRDAEFKQSDGAEYDDLDNDQAWLAPEED